MSTLVTKNLQIGADGTASNNFTVYQPVSPDGTLRIGNGNSGTTSAQVVLTSAGNVGIGTSSPALRLSVSGSLSATTQVVAGTTTTYSDGAIGTPSLQWNANAGARVGAISITDSTAAQNHYVLRNPNGNVASLGTDGTSLFFATSNLTERMRIDSTGNVGIGTSSPGRFGYDSNAKVLTVYGTRRGIIELGSETPVVNDTLGGVEFLGSTTSKAFVRGRLDGGDAGVIVFGTGNGTVPERMRIDSSGNLLIGTTSSGARLRVLSTASQSQSFYVTHPTSIQDVISCENSATSGNNMLIHFYTDATVSRGAITFNRAAGLTAYNTTSDYRAKDISGPVTDSGKLIDATPVYMGKMKGAAQERPMFIAHEVPAYAHTGEKDAVDAQGNPVYQQMDASALVPVLWAELQSLRARVAALESN